MDREESTGVSKHLVQDKLLNWALWCEWGLIGPPVQTRAASAEGDYTPELGEIYDPPEPVIEPDFEDGERMERLIRELPELQRRIVKAKYVSFPYQKHFSVAQKLRISQDRFELELRLATERLARKWSKEQMHGSQHESAN